MRRSSNSATPCRSILGTSPPISPLRKPTSDLEEHQRAVDHFRRVLDLDADNREAKVRLGGYQLMAGDFREARRAAEEVLEKDPNHLEARILLGNVFAGLNDLGRSVKELKQVLEVQTRRIWPRT
jgi:tetratricopeptide (TPR) repeat protein